MFVVEEKEKLADVSTRFLLLLLLFPPLTCLLFLFVWLLMAAAQRKSTLAAVRMRWIRLEEEKRGRPAVWKAPPPPRPKTYTWPITTNEGEKVGGALFICSRYAVGCLNCGPLFSGRPGSCHFHASWNLDASSSSTFFLSLYFSVYTADLSLSDNCLYRLAAARFVSSWPARFFLSFFRGELLANLIAVHIPPPTKGVVGETTSSFFTV